MNFDKIARSLSLRLENGRPPTKKQIALLVRYMKDSGFETSANRHELLKSIFALDNPLDSTSDLSRGQVESLIRLFRGKYAEQFVQYIKEKHVTF